MIPGIILKSRFSNEYIPLLKPCTQIQGEKNINYLQLYLEYFTINYSKLSILKAKTQVNLKLLFCIIYFKPG